MNWLLALANYIEDQGFGTKGTDLFIGALPGVDGVSTLLSQSGGDVIETYASGIAIRRPALQVKVTGDPEDFLSPFNKIMAIQDSLVLIANQPLSGIDFLRVRPTSGVLSLGRDDNLSYEFTANFEVSYE